VKEEIFTFTKPITYQPDDYKQKVKVKVKNVNFQERVISCIANFIGTCTYTLYYSIDFLKIILRKEKNFVHLQTDNPTKGYYKH